MQKTYKQATPPSGKTRLRGFRGANHRIHLVGGPCPDLQSPFSRAFTFTFMLKDFARMLEVEPVPGKNTAALCRTCVLPAVERLRKEDAVTAVSDFSRVEKTLDVDLTDLAGVRRASTALVSASELLEELDKRDHGSSERFLALAARACEVEAALTAVHESRWLKDLHLEELSLEVCQPSAPKSAAAAVALEPLHRAAAQALARCTTLVVVDEKDLLGAADTLTRRSWFRPGRIQVLPVALFEWCTHGRPQDEVPFVEIDDVLPSDVLEALDTLVSEGMDLETALAAASAF